MILIHRERDEAGIVQLSHPLTAICRHGDAEQAIARVSADPRQDPDQRVEGIIRQSPRICRSTRVSRCGR
jgi:hypothetical protein